MRFFCWLFTAPLFICLGGRAGAQQFNIRVDPHGPAGQASTAWSIEPTLDGGYMVIAAADFTDSLYSSSVVTTVLLDQSGDVLSIERFIHPGYATYPGWSNSTARRIDGGFTVGGNTFTIDSEGNWISRAALFQIAQNGTFEPVDLVGPDSASWIGRQAKQTPDGGFVICGEFDADGIQSDAFLIKIDPQGNAEWTATYGAANSYDFYVSVDLAQGGGYYLGGQRGSGPSNRDQWVVRTDALGGVIWSNNYGTPGGGDGLAQVTAMSNDDCVFGSSWQTGSEVQLQGCLVRLDPQGEVVWSRRYGPVASVVMHTVQELQPSNDLIVCGSIGLSIDYFGSLLRTTSEGDSLWMRYYQYYDSVVSNGRGIFRDVVPTPDGGFIACGTALPVSVADTLLYTQDVWVVKTDSMGCIEPGCHLITGMETQFTNMKDVLRVFPNPALSGGTVQVELVLPGGFVPNGALRLSVISSDGRLVHEEGIASNSLTFQLNMNLSAGLYHLHLSDATRWISGTKLIVE